MPSTEISDLIQHLTRIAPLSEAQASQVIDEVVAYYHEDVESFVRSRHNEMQQQGLSNAQIFAAIQSELQGRLFAATTISERQIRRMIYG